MTFGKIRDNSRLTDGQAPLRQQFFDQYNASVSRYKYQTFDKLQYLSKDKLFISDPVNFNDPFDLRLTLHDDLSSAGFSEPALQKAFIAAIEEWPHISDHWFYDAETFEALQYWTTGRLPLIHVEEAIKARFKKFGVACFSTELNQPLMWSHYGASHKGMCVQYFVRSMTLASESDLLQYYVSYTSRLPPISLTEVLFAPRNVGQRMLATKSIDWAYEKEWRLIHPSVKGETVDMPSGMEVASIIIGLSADADDRAKAFAKGNELQIPVFQVGRDHGSYDFLLDVTWPSV
ncbi:hypothetical protein D3C81_1179570 [compost metagenome]